MTYSGKEADGAARWMRFRATPLLVATASRPVNCPISRSEPELIAKDRTIRIVLILTLGATEAHTRWHHLAQVILPNGASRLHRIESRTFTAWRSDLLVLSCSLDSIEEFRIKLDYFNSPCAQAKAKILDEITETGSINQLDGRF